MKTIKLIKNQKYQRLTPFKLSEEELDKLAREWIEIVLEQIQHTENSQNMGLANDPVPKSNFGMRIKI